MSAAAEALGVVAEALERLRQLEANAGNVDAGPRAYTPVEVAERLGVSERTVYRLIDDGRLPVVPHLPKRRISAEAFERFLRGES